MKITCSLTLARRGAKISSILGSAMVSIEKCNFILRCCFLLPHCWQQTGNKVIFRFTEKFTKFLLISLILTLHTRDRAMSPLINVPSVKVATRLQRERIFHELSLKCACDNVTYCKYTEGTSKKTAKNRKSNRTIPNWYKK